jgi:glycosyltransferase involved in cell wall biosynthesis
VSALEAPALTALRERELAVRGVADACSLGVARYARRLREALEEHGVRYALAERPRSGPAHHHLANSSRALLRDRRGRRYPFAVTVHDVVPRTSVLVPVYRLLAYPRLREARAVIVHSAFAADLLVREAGSAPARLEVIAHPARRPDEVDRLAARRALGWPEEATIAVLPGVIKAAKLVREALEAVERMPGWQIALAGRIADPGAANAARQQGGLVLADPDDEDYDRAIAAADCVLCLRGGSVGETNGPLLDALGAGRAVLATPTGSIPEVAGEAAAYCEGTADGIRRGLALLGSADVRADLERAASDRASELTWDASAALHAALFREVLDA